VKTGVEQTGDEGVEILDYAGWQTILLKFIEISANNQKFWPCRGIPHSCVTGSFVPREDGGGLLPQAHGSSAIHEQNRTASASAKVNTFCKGQSGMP
jgi:hypothetical protein